MTADDIISHFRIQNKSITYLNQVINQYLKVERVKNKNGEEYVTTYSFPIESIHDGEIIHAKGKGRPFVFPRELFLSELEITRLEAPGGKQLKMQILEQTTEYKFRAEAEADAIKFFEMLPSGLPTMKVEMLDPEKRFPDVVITFQCNLELHELRAMMRTIEDSHVMLQTIAPADQYTGKRNYEIQ